MNNELIFSSPQTPAPFIRIMSRSDMAESPKKIIYSVSTQEKITPGEILKSFFEKSIKLIDQTLFNARTKHPQMFKS